MNWDAIGAIGELFGGVVVIATLFYLTAQIRQNHNSNLMVAATHMGETSDAWIRQIVQDATLSDLYHRGLLDYESLDQPERRRFNMLLLQLLRSIETAWAQQGLGVLNDDQWHGYEFSILKVIGSPGGRVAFEKIKGNFTERFVTMVQDVLAN